MSAEIIIHPGVRRERRPGEMPGAGQATVADLLAMLDRCRKVLAETGEADALVAEIDGLLDRNEPPKRKRRRKGA